jgi:hypothetical protein
LKAGGARKTKIAGRPWQFACIVHGFTNQTMGLKFEWAWQHCDRSIAVRNALGTPQAKALKRKRGVFGKLSILKALVTECEDVYQDAPNLKIYFFDEKIKVSFEKIKLESGVDLPESVSCHHIESYEQMPFWNDRGRKNQNNYEENKEVTGDKLPKDCMLCCRPIKFEEQFVTCRECLRHVHDICNDLHAEEGDGLCPRCDTLLDCDTSYQNVESSSDERDTDSISMRIAKVDFSDSQDDDRSSDSLEELLAPACTFSKMATKQEYLGSLDGTLSPKSRWDDEIVLLSDADESPIKIPPTEPKIARLKINSSSEDDSSTDMVPSEVRPKESLPSDHVIDLCSP